MIASPMKSRDALEKASAILRRGRLPPKLIADHIADALDAMVLAMALQGGQPEGATITIMALGAGEVRA